MQRRIVFIGFQIRKRKFCVQVRCRLWEDARLRSLPAAMFLPPAEQGADPDDRRCLFDPTSGLGAAGDWVMSRLVDLQKHCCKL